MTGDGNIRREVTFCLYSFRISKTGKNDRPVRAVGFGLQDDKRSLSPVDLLLDPERPGFEVQVIRLQGQNFSPPQSCG